VTVSTVPGKWVLRLDAWQRAVAAGFGRCSRCPALVHWIKVPPNWRNMPVDVATAEVDLERGRVVVTTHFASCPEADSFRKTREQGAKRRCPHPGCSERIPDKLFACATHWHTLPAALRKAIVGAYREGQEGAGWSAASETYRNAAALAMQHWQRAIDAKRTRQSDLW